MIIFFNDTATTEIYTLSLHDALPISQNDGAANTLQRIVFGTLQNATVTLNGAAVADGQTVTLPAGATSASLRSEEHTSELQSRQYLVCRLLLEKKKKKTNNI